jgi:hypothetical protein
MPMIMPIIMLIRIIMIMVEGLTIIWYSFRQNRLIMGADFAGMGWRGNCLLPVG